MPTDVDATFECLSSLHDKLSEQTMFGSLGDTISTAFQSATLPIVEGVLAIAHKDRATQNESPFVRRLNPTHGNFPRLRGKDSHREAAPLFFVETGWLDSSDEFSELFGRSGSLPLIAVGVEPTPDTLLPIQLSIVLTGNKEQINSYYIISWKQDYYQIIEYVHGLRHPQYSLSVQIGLAPVGSNQITQKIRTYPEQMEPLFSQFIRSLDKVGPYLTDIAQHYLQWTRI